MKRRKTKANIFFLDCCRTFVYDESRGDSPKPTSFSTRFTDDTLYAHATAPGHTASDGHDGHGTMSRRGKGVYRVTSIDHHIVVLTLCTLSFVGIKCRKSHEFRFSFQHVSTGLFTASILRHLTKRLPLRKVLDIINREVKKNSEGTQNPVGIALSPLCHCLIHFCSM